MINFQGRKILAVFGLIAAISLGCAPEICDNNKDDDGDSLADTQDADCRDEICDDGKDNDDDGNVDCDDYVCTTDDACTSSITSSGCCKNCGSTSKPCGDTCISNSNTCHTVGGCACY